MCTVQILQTGDLFYKRREAMVTQIGNSYVRCVSINEGLIALVALLGLCYR